MFMVVPLIVLSVMLGIGAFLIYSFFSGKGLWLPDGDKWYSPFVFPRKGDEKWLLVIGIVFNLVAVTGFIALAAEW